MTSTMDTLIALCIYFISIPVTCKMHQSEEVYLSRRRKKYALKRGQIVNSMEVARLKSDIVLYRTSVSYTSAQGDDKKQKFTAESVISVNRTKVVADGQYSSNTNISLNKNITVDADIGFETEGSLIATNLSPSGQPLSSSNSTIFHDGIADAADAVAIKYPKYNTTIDGNIEIPKANVTYFPDGDYVNGSPLDDIIVKTIVPSVSPTHFHLSSEKPSAAFDDHSSMENSPAINPR